MVLRSNNTSKRADAENTPPATLGSKALVSRIQSSIHDAARRRRARTSGSGRTLKYSIDKAKKRNSTKTKPSVRFMVTTVPTVPSLDVEMKDAVPSPSTSKTFFVGFPRELARPDYKEISPDVLQAIDPSLVGTDMDYLREHLEVLGPDLLQSLSSIKANPPPSHLPTELAIIVNDMTSILPTHMLAIFGKQAPNTSGPRKVTLYPAHSLVLATQCANLPAFPPALSIPTHVTGQQEVKVAVWSLCLPSPATYLQLSKYLYNKNVDILMRSLLPCAPPPMFGQDPTQVVPFATQLAETYTVQALVKYTVTVHGLWQNVCALGVFDDALWDTMDTMWQTLLTALAIATGTPSSMISSEATQTTTEPVASSSSSTFSP